MLPHVAKPPMLTQSTRPPAEATLRVSRASPKRLHRESGHGGKVKPSISDNTKGRSNIVPVKRFTAIYVLNFMLLGVPEREIVPHVVVQGERSQITI